jgi:hypothetical protein
MALKLTDAATQLAIKALAQAFQDQSDATPEEALQAATELMGAAVSSDWPKSVPPHPTGPLG